jgi:hypothetical protein
MMNKACTVLMPLVLVLGTAYFVRMPRDAGATVSFRPPAYFFSILWPLLLILLGYSLWDSPIKTPHLLLTGCFVLWLALYSVNKKKEALWLLGGQLFLSLLIFSQPGQAFAGSALTAWLVFALLLLSSELQSQDIAATSWMRSCSP